MTKEEKFDNGIVVEKLDNDYIYMCELWSSSTKHPDARFFYSDWKDKSKFFSDEYQVFQWLLWIASQLQFPYYAKRLTEYALKNWYKN